MDVQAFSERYRVRCLKEEDVSLVMAFMCAKIALRLCLEAGGVRFAFYFFFRIWGFFRSTAL